LIFYLLLTVDCFEKQNKNKNSTSFEFPVEKQQTTLFFFAGLPSKRQKID